MHIHSKLPHVGTSIFAEMSALANEYQAINLSQGFPDYDSPAELVDRVAHYLKDSKNQYAPMPGVAALRKAIANKAAHSYGISIDGGEEITITAGATQAIFTAITAFVKSGDEVIIIEPAYDCYLPAIKLMGGIPKIYQLEGPEFKIDWNIFKKLLSIRTKMIIINTPHNPVGTTLSREDMMHLERLTEGTDTIILSDEVYEHIIFDGIEHQSILKFPNLYRRSIAVYSFGKTFHCTGWKIGYAIAPPALMQEFRKVHQFNVFCVNSFLQYALADYLQDPAHYEYLGDFYQKKRDFLLNNLASSALKPVPCHGSYFQLFDYSEISDLPDKEFAKLLTKEHGVAVIPVSSFNTNGLDNKMIRVCFAKKEDTLAQAAEKLNLL